jgi:hypothetical protein
VADTLYRRLYRWYEGHRRLALVYHLLTGRFFLPSHAAVLLADLRGRREPVRSNREHVEAAVGWLFRGQDATGTGGVASDYSFSWGWSWPLPEVTGYIIPTLYDVAVRCGGQLGEECRRRALAMADWLLAVQREEGAWCYSLHPAPKGSFANRISGTTAAPGAFDTAQILHGLLRTWRETEQKQYLDAAVRAGGWLVETQAADGTWSSSLHNVPHTFDTFLAWRLVELSRATDDVAYRGAAVRSLDRALGRVGDNGWPDGCSHFPGAAPLTHSIAYAAQGFIESGRLLDEPRYSEAGRRIADGLLAVYNENGRLPARLDRDWRSRDSFTCLTGNAQAAYVWLDLFRMTGEERYREAAATLIKDLKTHHNARSGNGGINGGVKGSQPGWGEYATFRYLSWAAKFFIDVLLLEETVTGGGHVR